MCGIAGLLNFDGRPADPGRLKRMADAVAHRGPDDEGLWIDGPVGLAHRRLAIRDLSAAGHQPIQDPMQRVTVTYNGELYNDGALREALIADAGAQFRGYCDAEVLPTGLAAWDTALLPRLEGIYAFAAWHSGQRSLTLVRDHAGIKPLFYLRTPTALYFASEIKGILAALDDAPAIDAANLHRFLAQGYVSPEETTLTGVRQVPPGSSVTISHQGEMTVERFFRPHRSGELANLDEAVEEFLALWEQVIDDQLISDVPVGILQSGGIDSSLVSFGLSRQRRVPLFTASFSERSHDETELARAVAESTGRRLHTVPVQGDRPAETVLRNVVHAFDGQVADASAYAFYQLAAAVREHVSVALSGDGADEFFGGYQTYRASRVAGLMQPFAPAGLARRVSRMCYRAAAGREGRLPMADVAFRFAAGLANGGPQAHVHWRRLLPDFALDGVYGPELAQARGDDPFDRYAAVMRAGEGSRTDRCLLSDQQFHLPAGLLQKTDAMSMAHALEVRVPFLDSRVLRFAGRCRADLFTPLFGPGKKMLRHALAARGAPENVVAGAKRGFNVPIAQLLRGPLSALGERYLGQGGDLLAPYLRPEGVGKLWREHIEGRANHAYALWPILTFAIWRETL